MADPVGFIEDPPVRRPSPAKVPAPAPSGPSANDAVRAGGAGFERGTLSMFGLEPGDIEGAFSAVTNPHPDFSDIEGPTGGDLLHALLNPIGEFNEKAPIALRALARGMNPDAFDTTKAKEEGFLRSAEQSEPTAATVGQALPLVGAAGNAVAELGPGFLESARNGMSSVRQGAADVLRSNDGILHQARKAVSHGLADLISPQGPPPETFAESALGLSATDNPEDFEHVPPTPPPPPTPVASDPLPAKRPISGAISSPIPDIGPPPDRSPALELPTGVSARRPVLSPGDAGYDPSAFPQQGAAGPGGYSVDADMLREGLLLPGESRDPRGPRMDNGISPLGQAAVDAARQEAGTGSMRNPLRLTPQAAAKPPANPAQEAATAVQGPEAQAGLRLSSIPPSDDAAATRELGLKEGRDILGNANAVDSPAAGMVPRNGYLRPDLFPEAQGAALGSMAPDKMPARLLGSREAQRIGALPREQQQAAIDALARAHGTAPWQAGGVADELGLMLPGGAPAKAEARYFGVHPLTGQTDRYTLPLPSSMEGAHTLRQEMSGEPWKEHNPLMLRAIEERKNAVDPMAPFIKQQAEAIMRAGLEQNASPPPSDAAPFRLTAAPVEQELFGRSSMQGKPPPTAAEADPLVNDPRQSAMFGGDPSAKPAPENAAASDERYAPRSPTEAENRASMGRARNGAQDRFRNMDPAERAAKLADLSPEYKKQMGLEQFEKAAAAEPPDEFLRTMAGVKKPAVYVPEDPDATGVRKEAAAVKASTAAERAGAKADALPKDRGEVLAQLLDANGIRDHDSAQADAAYKAWKAGGRKGPKPTSNLGGMLDAFQAERDKPGSTSSLLEAFEKETKSAKTWRDIKPALAALAEALGVDEVRLPDEVNARHIAQDADRSAR